jgi:hypothetical protein
MNQEEFRVRHGFWATAEWFDYFKSNRNILEAIDWERGRGLTDDEKLRIFDSIREFQLGESSEGRNLNEFARYYSGKNADPLYYESVKLFIREEQRHSQALGRFMEREGIPKLEKSFVDSVFRNLRRYAGLEISLTVLLVAEIISLVYYRALGGAASSDSLRKICGQILKDERRHLTVSCEFGSPIFSRDSCWPEPVWRFGEIIGRFSPSGNLRGCFGMRCGAFTTGPAERCTSVKLVVFQ